jgi:hypothetical protein
LIYNEYFRDENIQDSYSIDVSDGPDTSTYEVDRSRKIKDYFTGCLPWPQKGTASFINDMGRDNTIQIKRKTKIIIKITSNSFTSMLGDSVISSIARVILGSIELFPILPNNFRFVLIT